MSPDHVLYEGEHLPGEGPHPRRPRVGVVAAVLAVPHHTHPRALAGVVQRPLHTPTCRTEDVLSVNQEVPVLKILVESVDQDHVCGEQQHQAAEWHHRRWRCDCTETVSTEVQTS